MKHIPYSHQSIDQRDILEVQKVLESDLITQGPKVKYFEDALCKYTGAKYAVCVCSGTAALHAACFAAGIQVEDEVITSPITFVASVNCILYCGGKPVFADVCKDTANIDPEQIKNKITHNTKAIIPVHLCGLPCRMEDIMAIAREKGLIVIEDACHALGASYRGSRVGSCKYSDMTVFSFHPVKTITTGEGGAILTNNQVFYKKLLQFRNHGVTKNKKDLFNKEEPSWYYEMQYLGFNYRLTDIQAALGISQLKKVNQFVSKRRKIAALYDLAFRGNPYFDIPQTDREARSAYHLYPIRLKSGLESKRKKIFSNLLAKGIGVQVHYIPVYFQPYYRNLGYRRGLCPRAEDYYQSEISIPIYPTMTARQISYVIKAIKEKVRK